jgi:hypothetical protein
VHSTRDPAQRLVDQRTPHEQVRFLASRASRLAQAVATLQTPTPGASSETANPWETFFPRGEVWAATDTCERQRQSHELMFDAGPMPVGLPRVLSPMLQTDTGSLRAHRCRQSSYAGCGTVMGLDRVFSPSSTR